MAAYRYLFADLVTGGTLAELPLTQVNFQRELNGAGAFNAMLATTDAKVTALDWVDATQEARTAIYVDRDGVIVWGGILWAVRKTKSATKLALRGAEMWSYFQHRLQTTSISWTAADQAQIVADLLNGAQAKAGGNIRVTVPAVVATGITRTLALTGNQFINIGQQIQDLAAMTNGFDFAIDVQYSGTPPTPTATFTLSYPARGIRFGASTLVFEEPGNIIDYDWPRDGSVKADTVYSVGSGSGPAMLTSTASNSALLTAGYPLLETTTQYKDVTAQAVLDAHAQADVNLLSQAAELASVTVRAAADPMLGSYTVGDEGRFRITDEMNPAPAAGGAGLDAYYRLIGYTVYPADTGAAVHDSVKLQLGPVWS